MGGPTIDLKFAGGILGSTGILAGGLLEMCMIHFNCYPTGLFRINVAKGHFQACLVPP